MYNFHDSTDTLKFWTEKWAINKTFLFFIPIWWNLVVHMDNCNFTKFYQNQMKNKKVSLVAHFSVPNFKVSVESWKLYIANSVLYNIITFLQFIICLVVLRNQSGLEFQIALNAHRWHWESMYKERWVCKIVRISW